MRLVVCIKQVPNTAEVTIDPQTHTLVREGIDNVLNPLDAYALEEALRLKERYGGETVALSMGPPQAHAALREALSLGIDRAILLCGPEFAGSDTWCTATALACAIRTLGGADVVLCGKQAIDGDTAQVGPELAELLELPQVTCVTDVVSIDSGRLRARSAVEGGEIETETELPCLLTAVKELNEPRLPTLAGQMRGRRAEIETWNASAIGADAATLGLDGSPTRVVSIFAPQVHRAGRRVNSLEPTALRDVARFIRKRIGKKPTKLKPLSSQP